MTPLRYLPVLALLPALLSGAEPASDGDTLSTVVAVEEGAVFRVDSEAEVILDQYCFSCHEEGTEKGDIRLDDLGGLSLDARLELLNKMQEQVFFEEMPPKKKKAQPTDAERQQLVGWISGELHKHSASKLEEKLERPEFGNYVKHDKLFSGDYRDLPGFTHDRRWLISEFIFEARINRLLDHEGVRTIDGRQMPVMGDNGVNLGTQFGGASLRQSITNPFLLPATIGVRYYDTSMLTGGHLLTMISNAEKIAAYMSSEQVMKSRYPAMHRIMGMELDHRDTLKRRENFLNNHIERLVLDLYKERNDALLPEFVRVKVEEVPESTDARDAARKETNLELLWDRHDPEDVGSIYRGVGKHELPGDTFEQVIEKCEREWFILGVHEQRIRERVGLMNALMKRWDMTLIHGDIRKKNLRPEPYKPLPEPEMDIIRTSILKNREQGDSYRRIIDKCMGEWERSFVEERAAAGRPDDGLIGDLVTELFAKVFERTPTAEESLENIDLAKTYMGSLGNHKGITKLIETLLLDSELVYRPEFGQGEADAHGRRMLSPREASYALAYALTDGSPDEELVAAADSGRLGTREDYRREVTRLLAKRDQYYIIDETVQKTGFNSSITNTPIRKLRFFREFFGYPKALDVFKDDERFAAGSYENVKGRLVDEADMLVDHILQKDHNVFEELLTTEQFYVFHSGDNEAMTAASDRIRKIYDYFKEYDWENFTEEELYTHWDFIKEMKLRGTVFPDFETDEKRRSGWVRSFKSMMASYAFRLANGQAAAAPYDSISMAYWHKGDASTRTDLPMRGEQVGTLFGIDYAHWDYPTVQPAKVANRKGLLTHPAWLIAHAQNAETDPVIRGKWVREKLLAGTVPDVPITVDAVIPEDHHKTLRSRLAGVTEAASCWKCHERMNPLGYTFEIYDDFGRYRTEERLEHPENLIKAAPKERGIHIDGRAGYKTLPVDAGGYLAGTGDPSLDGEVRDAIDLAARLGKSERVRQSIIRHAFRYFLGRNEVLSDSGTLIDADRAYVESGGSFDAVIVSLLSSDSFIYRKPGTNQHHDH